MNIRMKLILGTLMVIVITVIFSTIGVSYLVRKQNDENGKSQVLKGVKFTIGILKDLQVLNIGRISDFSSNPTQVINFRYLLEIKKKEDSGAYKFILEQPKEEMLSALLVMIREGNFDGIRAYDGDGDLLIYLDRTENHIEIGLITTDDKGSRIIKYQKVIQSGSISPSWQKRLFEAAPEPKSGLPFPDQPESDFGVIHDRLALTGIVPVVSTDLYLETEEKKIGCVKFYRFLDQGFAENLAKKTEMDVNIFTGSKLTSGTLKVSDEISANVLARIEQQKGEGNLFQSVEVISIGKREYYQAMVPFFLKNDYIGAIVLSLSREDTLRKTRENIILLFLIMGVCMIIVIPGAILMSGKLSNRISSILAVVKGTTGGDLSARIKFSSNDELGMLARAFNQMAQDLQNIMKELKDSEDKYRAIFENSGTALIFIEEDMTISITNKEFEKLSGHAKAEVEGSKKWTDFVAKQDDLERMKKYHRLRRTDPQAAPQTYEFKFIDREGNLKDVVVTVAVLPGTKQSLAALLEITERKRAEEALHESERKFRAIFDQTFQFIGLMAVDGTLIEANKSALRFRGVDESVVIGKPFWETPWWTHSPELQEKLCAAVKKAAEGEFVRFEATHPAADGSLHYVDFSLKPVLDEAGNVILLIPEGRDINERKRAEEEIQRLNAELEQRVVERTAQLEAANRELEAFSYSVSHDLRAPLRGIDGWSLALLEDCWDRLDERGREHLKRVRQEAQRMGRLIDDLLELSRVTRADMTREPVDLSALARSIAERLQSTEPDRKVEFVIHEGSMTYGDPRLLEVMLANLLENAWKFTGKHASAQIEFGRTEIEAKTAYFVGDDGAGFDMAYAGKLFGGFQRMHSPSEFPGTGVGLATVQRIVHRHGGRVWAEAEVEKGATFYFSL